MWWDKVFAVNARGTFLCTRAVFPYMRDQRSGKIRQRGLDDDAADVQQRERQQSALRGIEGRSNGVHAGGSAGSLANSTSTSIRWRPAVRIRIRRWRERTLLRKSRARSDAVASPATSRARWRSSFRTTRISSRASSLPSTAARKCRRAARRVTDRGAEAQFRSFPKCGMTCSAKSESCCLNCSAGIPSGQRNLT